MHLLTLLRLSQEYNVAAPALEDIIIWDTRKGEPTQVLKGDTEEVTCLEVASNRTLLAAAYQSGKILLWKLATGTSDTTLSGHRSPVGTLVFSADCARLVSGSQVGNLIHAHSQTTTSIFMMYLPSRTLHSPGLAGH